jgi:hypothetical protein
MSSIMSNIKSSIKSNGVKRAGKPGLHQAVCMIGIGIFLALFAGYSYGQQAHQLSYNNSVWADDNLNGSVTDAFSTVGAFTTAPNNGLHVYYQSHDDHIHQAYNVGGGWKDEDLTTEAKAIKSSTGCNVVGFSLQNFQYVFYVGTDFHVHELLYNNSIWADTDLTVAGHGDKSNGFEIVAFVTTPNNALHVYYSSANEDTEQLYNVGGGWANENLTTETRAPLNGGGWMTGFSLNNFQYVYYYAADGDLHQLFYNNSSWSDEDLTALTGMGQPNPPGEMSALVVPGTKKLRVYYIDRNNHVIQLASTNNKKWIGADLTKKAKGPLASPENGMVAFVTTPNNQIHVFYDSSTNHVNQLFLPTPAKKWSNTDLSATAENGDSVRFATGMAGFSIANLQYVYYVGN